MRNINHRYVSETYDANGVLSSFAVHYPDDFNFAYDVVDDIAIAEPDRPAMIWCNPEGEEHFFSFGDMKYWSDKTANWFASLGIGRGDMVLVLLRRHYQFWFVALALHKLGAVLVPATFMLKEHDLEYRLNAASIKAVVCTDAGDIAGVVDAVVPICPSVQHRILVNGAGGGLTSPEQIAAGIVGSRLSGPDGVCAAKTPAREGWLAFNENVRSASPQFGRRATLAADPMIMYFSSGTSGNPKMVLHDSGYAIGHIGTAKHWQNVKSDGGVHWSIADTGWGKAVWGKFYGQWIMEACVFTYDFNRFDAAQILECFGRYHITTFCCPPTMYRMLMREGLEGHDLSSLEYSVTAGEALNPDLFEEWRRQTGLTIMEGFGQTETPLTICNVPGSTPKPGSMGKPLCLYTIQIQHPDGTQCKMGQSGEICIKVEQPDGTRAAGIMIEYYRDAEKTAGAIHDGWYHTGDVAWMDEDGHYWYVGRNDDVIKSSGYRIGPFEIESVLLEHEAVRECAVTGVPDPLRGQAVKATVVRAPGFHGDGALSKELQPWVKRKTAPYKYPRIIDYVDELPKTVNGKVMRVVIRERDKR